MGRGSGRQSRTWVRGAIVGIWIVVGPVSAQEDAGDQRFRFQFSQKFSANDNIRLDPTSVGTTYYSDSTFSFGFLSETALQSFDLSASGVLRAANDPIVGTDSAFRDPTVNLSYTRDNANSRFNLYARYARPDLAFLDPLEQAEIDDQDLFSGGGQREDISAGVRLETGLQAPLGFVFGLDTRSRDYVNTTDPLLVPNRTDSASIGTRFQLSPVMQGRVDLFESRFDQEAGGNPANARQTDTSRVTAGLDIDLSPVSVLMLDLGHSNVTETFDAIPGLENVTSGLVGSAAFIRAMPDGQITANLGSTLTTQGRQTTLRFGRDFDLPRGELSFSLGITQGASFDALPIGSVSYTSDLPRGRLTAGLSRSVSISDTLNQATTTTRARLGYTLDVNDLSDLSFNLSYADIALAGTTTATGTDRARGNFTAAYRRDVTDDWGLRVGYAYRYYNPDNAAESRSNEVFFVLERDFNVFR